MLHKSILLQSAFQTKKLWTASKSNKFLTSFQFFPSQLKWLVNSISAFKNKSKPKFVEFYSVKVNHGWLLVWFGKFSIFHSKFIVLFNARVQSQHLLWTGWRKCVKWQFWRFHELNFHTMETLEECHALHRHLSHRRR